MWHVCGHAIHYVMRFLIDFSSFSFVALCTIGWCLLQDPWHCLPVFLPFTKPPCKLAMPVSEWWAENVQKYSLTSSHISQPGHWLLDSAGVKPWPCWLKQCSQTRGYRWAKGKVQTKPSLVVNHSVKPVTQHTAKDIFCCFNPFLPGFKSNKQGKFYAQQILCKPRIVMWNMDKWWILRKWTGSPEQSKTKKETKIKTSSQLWLHLLSVMWLRIITCSTGIHL